MIEKSLNTYPLEYRVKVLREILFLEYPFTLEDMIDYENNINFKILSKNHHINWSKDILDTFKNKWDWKAIQTNPFIIPYYNLGLLYPEYGIVKPAKCRCELQLEFCNKERICYSEYNKELMGINHRNPLHLNYSYWIRYLMKDGHINSQNLGNFLLYDAIINDVNSDKCLTKNSSPENDLRIGYDENEVPF